MYCFPLKFKATETVQLALLCFPELAIWLPCCTQAPLADSFSCWEKQKPCARDQEGVRGDHLYEGGVFCGFVFCAVGLVYIVEEFEGGW